MESRRGASSWGALIGDREEFGVYFEAVEMKGAFINWSYVAYTTEMCVLTGEKNGG